MFDLPLCVRPDLSPIPGALPLPGDHAELGLHAQGGPDRLKQGTLRAEIGDDLALEVLLLEETADGVLVDTIPGDMVLRIVVR
ncbi:hypothetical protein ANRL2_00890 [Anaerolineae bacterium]|nr:hypothetical protein ANRL2_00890 [Anaerolineae bacterium]